MYDCADHLSKSDKGREALRAILAWLDAGGCSLDIDNQNAVLTLLSGAFGRFPGSSRDAMREALVSTK